MHFETIILAYRARFQNLINRSIEIRKAGIVESNKQAGGDNKIIEKRTDSIKLSKRKTNLKLWRDKEWDRARNLKP